ncbi:MAG: DUF4149 domain-containing protein [Burkholderiales bacterium]|nr:DUF4149 domain-containing protein [Burkholderiales bacterium]
MLSKLRQATEISLWAIWIGSLWTMALLIAPGLFKWLPREEAGMVASRFFFFLAWSNISTPSLLMLFSWASPEKPRRSAWVSLLLIMGLALLALFVMQPQMAELRLLMQNASGDELASAKAQFGRLHAVSTVMFSLQMLAGLWWGWMRYLFPVKNSV